MSKLSINFENGKAKKLRHYWRSNEKRCDCGCKDRIFLKGVWYCAVALQEVLNDQGYSLEKNYTSVNMVDPESIISVAQGKKEYKGLI